MPQTRANGKGSAKGKGQRAKGKGMVAFLALLEKQTAIVLFCLYDPLLVLNLIIK